MSRLIFRKAEREDLEEIVRMLSDDILGKDREKYALPLPQCYVQAFEEINQSSHNLLVAVDHPDKKVVGTMQLTFIPNISNKGSKRLLIEAVRVDDRFCGKGLGSKMIEWAINEGKRQGCKVAQLTTNKIREEAHNFYKKLGFKDTHLGMKLDIS